MTVQELSSKATELNCKFVQTKIKRRGNIFNIISQLDNYKKEELLYVVSEIDCILEHYDSELYKLRKEQDSEKQGNQ